MVIVIGVIHRIWIAKVEEKVYVKEKNDLIDVCFQIEIKISVNASLLNIIMKI